MTEKTLMESYEAGELSEAAELILLRRAYEHHQKEEIAEIIRQQALQEAKVVRLRRNWFAAAASVLFAAMGWWIVVSKSIAPLMSQQAFAQVASPTASGDVLLGSHEIALERTIHRFNDAYAEKKYLDCIELEAKIVAAKPETQILLAYCYLQTNNYSKSIELLEKLYMKSEDSQEEIHWWLGLSYGLAGDKPNMKKYLSKIAPQQFHYQEAQLLLK
ncbi:MAG: hypothetical protein RIS64_3940 [Bacteroidota bacterium]|jgi:tetratricopeptide (TPR) repeat protein